MFDDQPWLANFRNASSVHFIETQRLLHDGSRSASAFSRGDELLEHSVDACARDLAQRIRDNDRSYGGISRHLDQSFPQRLLQEIEPLGLEAIQQELAKLDIKRKQLIDTGLISGSQKKTYDIGQFTHLTVAQRAVLTLYLEDSNKKLSTFSKLQARVEVLLGNHRSEILNHQS